MLFNLAPPSALTYLSKAIGGVATATTGDRSEAGNREQPQQQPQSEVERSTVNSADDNTSAHFSIQEHVKKGTSLALKSKQQQPQQQMLTRGSSSLAKNSFGADKKPVVGVPVGQRLNSSHRISNTDDAKKKSTHLSRHQVQQQPQQPIKSTNNNSNTRYQSNSLGNRMNSYHQQSQSITVDSRLKKDDNFQGRHIDDDGSANDSNNNAQPSATWPPPPPTGVVTTTLLSMSSSSTSSMTDLSESPTTPVPGGMATVAPAPPTPQQRQHHDHQQDRHHLGLVNRGSMIINTEDSQTPQVEMQQPSAAAAPPPPSAATVRKCQSTHVYFLDHYIDLLGYLKARKDRLEAFRKEQDRQQQKRELRSLSSPGQCNSVTLSNTQGQQQQQHQSAEQQQTWSQFCLQESQTLRLRRSRILPHQFTILTQVGQGGFGQVFLAQNNQPSLLPSSSSSTSSSSSSSSNHQLVALKRMRKRHLYAQEEITHILTERDVLSKTHSQWHVQLLYSFQDPIYVYLAMEYVPGGDVRSMLTARGVLREQDAMFYIAECICAVDELHSQGYIHRDLKPENFLIDLQGHIKLTDFGLSKGQLAEERIEGLKMELKRVGKKLLEKGKVKVPNVSMMLLRNNNNNNGSMGMGLNRASGSLYGSMGMQQQLGGIKERDHRMRVSMLLNQDSSSSSNSLNGGGGLKNASQSFVNLNGILHRSPSIAAMMTMGGSQELGHVAKDTNNNNNNNINSSTNNLNTRLNFGNNKSSIFYPTTTNSSVFSKTGGKGSSLHQSLLLNKSMISIPTTSSSRSTKSVEQQQPSPQQQQQQLRSQEPNLQPFLGQQRNHSLHPLSTRSTLNIINSQFDNDDEEEENDNDDDNGDQQQEPRVYENKGIRRAFSIVGSADYMAPEILATSLPTTTTTTTTTTTSSDSTKSNSVEEQQQQQGQGYDFGVDYWSLGCILFEFLSGYSPFQAEDTKQTCINVWHWRKVLKRPIYDTPENLEFNLSDPAWDLVTKLLTVREERLVDLKEIQKHEWFDELNQDCRIVSGKIKQGKEEEEKEKEEEEEEVDWSTTLRMLKPSFVPVLTDPTDTCYFDDFSNPEDMIGYKDVMEKQAKVCENDQEEDDRLYREQQEKQQQQQQQTQKQRQGVTSTQSFNDNNPLALNNLSDASLAVLPPVLRSSEPWKNAFVGFTFRHDQKHETTC